jgi:hypothetical protein
MRSFVSKMLVAAALVGSLPLQAFAAVPPTALGRILLDVNNRGQAWYVDPVTKDRTYVADGAAAYSMMRSVGLGITNAQLAKIPVGYQEEFHQFVSDTDDDGLDDRFEVAMAMSPSMKDSDSDGFSDLDEVKGGYDPSGAGKPVIDAALAKSLSGRILLQVEGRGEAWYVHPVDNKRYYMRDGISAYLVMRYFGLGATSETIASIPASSRQVDCGITPSCFEDSVKNRQPAFMVGGAPNPLPNASRGVFALMETHQLEGELAFRLTSYDAADLNAVKAVTVANCTGPSLSRVEEFARGWGEIWLQYGVDPALTTATAWRLSDYNSIGGCSMQSAGDAALMGEATTHGDIVDDRLREMSVRKAVSMDTERVADVKQIQAVLDLYYDDYGKYPVVAEPGIVLGTSENNCLSSSGFGFNCGNSTIYMSVVPDAPNPAGGSRTSAQNEYRYISDGSTYVLTFCLGAQVGSFTPGYHEVRPAAL